MAVGAEPLGIGLIAGGEVAGMTGDIVGLAGSVMEGDKVDIAKNAVFMGIGYLSGRVFDKGENSDVMNVVIGTGLNGIKDAMGAEKKKLIIDKNNIQTD